MWGGLPRVVRGSCSSEDRRFKSLGWLLCIEQAPIPLLWERLLLPRNGFLEFWIWGIIKNHDTCDTWLLPDAVNLSVFFFVLIWYGLDVTFIGLDCDGLGDKEPRGGGWMFSQWLVLSEWQKNVKNADNLVNVSVDGRHAAELGLCFIRYEHVLECGFNVPFDSLSQQVSASRTALRFLSLKTEFFVK